MKLHLGCGKRYLEGYVHVDIDQHKHINFQHEINYLPMFKDNTADEIYSCGVLEYFDSFEVKKVLQEWKRVLKVGGILRTSVPNFDSITKIYLKNKNIKSEGILGPLFGRIEIIQNNKNKVLFHKTVYDYESLKSLLKENGFIDISFFDPFEVFPDNFDDYSKAFVPFKDKSGIAVHLNLEAVKDQS